MLIRRINTVFPLVFLLLYSTYVFGEEAQWTSKLFPQLSNKEGDTFLPRTVELDGRGNMLVAVEKISKGEPQSSTSIVKTDSAGNTLWTFPTTSVRGTPFGISVDENAGVAFVVISESKENNVARGHVIRITDIHASDSLQKRRIRDELVFTTPGEKGITKLFGCVRNPKNGNIYLIGGTSTSLYRETSLGKGDAIVVSMDVSGKVLASNQFGSTDDEVGRSIDINEDGSALVVVTRRQFQSGLSTSEIYRLDPDDLGIIDGPHSPRTQGADPLFNPKSIAIIGPVASQPNTLVTYVAGDAVVKPDRRADIYFHVYSNIGSRVTDFSVAFDGANNLKGIDSCELVRVGGDANAYCLGYTDVDGETSSRRLNLIVISPTGQMLLKSERATGGVPAEETPTGLSILQNETSIKLVYVGHATVGNREEPSIGFIDLPQGSVLPFPGFQGLVTGAGIATSPQAENPIDDKPSIAAIAGGAAGGVAVLVAVVVGFVLLDRRRRHSSDSSATGARKTEEDYSREIMESFSDALSPGEKRIAKGALV